MIWHTFISTIIPVVQPLQAALSSQASRTPLDWMPDSQTIDGHSTVRRALPLVLSTGTADCGTPITYLTTQRISIIVLVLLLDHLLCRLISPF